MLTALSNNGSVPQHHTPANEVSSLPHVGITHKARQAILNGECTVEEASKLYNVSGYSTLGFLGIIYSHFRQLDKAAGRPPKWSLNTARVARRAKEIAQHHTENLHPCTTTIQPTKETPVTPKETPALIEARARIAKHTKKELQRLDSDIAEEQATLTLINDEISRWSAAEMECQARLQEKLDVKAVLTAL